MFILTFKLRKGRLAGALAALLLLGGLLIWSQAAPRQTAAAALVPSQGIRTEEDRRSYLLAWGWNTAPHALAVEEVVIPRSPGEEYGDYLALQTAQGFDLAPYAGKRVKRYAYQVLNYPDPDQEVTAHLLLWRDRVIGGDLLGETFLRGLAQPE